jgi:GntR family transcriptional repressor for pyruvate dehydrogenase complex
MTMEARNADWPRRASGAPVRARAKARAFEQVRDSILDDIRQGKLVPGSRLPSERALAEAFHVGRHAVREALRTLEMSGVLRFSPGTSGGAFVREQSGEGVSSSIRDMIVLGRMPLEDLMAVRVNLLVHAVELAVERANDEDFDAIADNIDEAQRLVEKGNPIATIAPLIEFNRLLGKASHNLVLAMFIDSLADIMEDVLTTYMLPTEIDVIGPRRDVLCALRRRDAARGVSAIRAHYAQTTGYVLERVKAMAAAPEPASPT